MVSKSRFGSESGGSAALAALQERLVAAHVELAFLDVVAVAEGALVDQDRLDVLLVADRGGALQLHHLDRLRVLLLIGEGQPRDGQGQHANGDGRTHELFPHQVVASGQ